MSAPPQIVGLGGHSHLATRNLQLDDHNTVVDLLIVFLGVAFGALLLTASLLLIRRMREQRAGRDGGLPQYNEIAHPKRHSSDKHRRLTIQTADGRSSIVLINSESIRTPMLADPRSAPDSPENVPQIHITFPDEADEFGHARNGRQFLVRVGDGTVGLEPVQEEQLPAYEKESHSSFQSIDMDQIGGLKEKDRSQFQ